MCLGAECEHENVDRRAFLTSSTAVLAGLAATGVAATDGEKQPPPTRFLDDPTIRHGKVTFKSGDKEIDGYLARPKAEGKYAAVLVVAGNLITEEYIPNTCAALAVAGYVGLAPNIFHPVPKGATPAEMNKALAGRTDDDYLRDVRAGADYLKGHEAVRAGGVGVLGFCSGGRRALLYAVRYDDAKAVVAFHTAAHTKAEEVVGLKVPVQMHHGKADRVSPFAVSQTLEKQLRSQGTPVEVFLYEGAEHGFLRTPATRSTSQTLPRRRGNARWRSWTVPSGSSHGLSAADPPLHPTTARGNICTAQPVGAAAGERDVRRRKGAFGQYLLHDSRLSASFLLTQSEFGERHLATRR